MGLSTLLTASSSVHAIPVCCSPFRLPAYLHESATFIASATPMTTRFPSAFICMAAILAASLVAFTSPRRQPVKSLFRAIQTRPCPIYGRSEEHTSELQSLMSTSYAVFCLKKKKKKIIIQYTEQH